MRIAIFGYGNLGRGVEYAARQNEDMELIGVFTRRDPAGVSSATGAPVFASGRVREFRGRIDVLILCGGSATDLPELTPTLARDFCVVDSFDNHGELPVHVARVDGAARSGGKLALVGAGWDPGLFSMARLWEETLLPDGTGATFWGRGVSQGHSEAIRRVEGVLDARQYTVPRHEAIARARDGADGDFSPTETHRRECFVVAADGADRERITREICAMPGYFAGYETKVTFITREEMQRNHAALPHGGRVIRSGRTGEAGERRQSMEFSLSLESNPEFTGSVLVAAARAVGRLAARGRMGCLIMPQIAPADFAPFRKEEIVSRFL